MTTKGYAVDKGLSRKSKKFTDLDEAITNIFKHLDHTKEESEREYNKYSRNNPKHSESQKVHSVEIQLNINGKKVPYSSREDAYRIIKENIETADKIFLQNMYVVGVDHHVSHGSIAFIETIENEEARIKKNMEELSGILPKGVVGIIAGNVVQGKR